MNPFETETMADLCLRQGHRDEALAIYRRLAMRAVDSPLRVRLHQRIAEVEGAAASSLGTDAPPSSAAGASAGVEGKAGPESPLPSPGLRARAAGEALTVEWRLPAGTSVPTMELLLLVRTPTGVAAERRSLPLDGAAGRMVLEVPGLHSARAAAGFVSDGRFVPLARG